MATESEKPTDTKQAPAPASVFDALQEAADELRKALGDLYLRSQRQDYEAKLQYAQEVQQAEFEQRKADGEAYWAMMEELSEASGSDDYRSLEFQRSHDYHRSVQDRSRDTEQRVAEAARAHQETAEAAQKEFLEELDEIHRAHIARLKEIWVALDPISVAPEEFAALGQYAAAAAQGMPPTAEGGGRRPDK